MKILIACEYSGRVRDAFRARGHHAVSCDLLPTESPGPHFQRDALQVASMGWDMLIAFPPCTHLSAVGAATWKQKRADGRQQAAARFFLDLWQAPIERVALENPVGWMNTHWRKPSQVIQPYQFGDPWMKKTCLWLRGLPKLEPTEVVEPLGHWVDGGSSHGRKLPLAEHNHLYRPLDPRRAHARSRSFRGISEAMAEQWS